MGKDRARRGTARHGRSGGGEPALEVPYPPVDFVEEGSFAYGCCPCGWRGPARRARTSASMDAELHRLTKCGAPDRERADASCTPPYGG